MSYPQVVRTFVHRLMRRAPTAEEMGEGRSPMDDIEPIPGLFRDAEELRSSWRQGVAGLPVDVLVRWTADVAEATDRGDDNKVRELTMAMLCTIRLEQNEDYRRAVKQVERAIEETTDHQPIDRQAHFSALRAAG